MADNNNKTVEYIRLSDYKGDKEKLYGYNQVGGGVYGMVYPPFTDRSKFGKPSVHAITLSELERYIPKEDVEKMKELDGNFGEIRRTTIHDGHMDYKKFAVEGDSGNPNEYTRIRMFEQTDFEEYIYFDEKFSKRRCDIMKQIMMKRVNTLKRIVWRMISTGVTGHGNYTDDTSIHIYVRKENEKKNNDIMYWIEEYEVKHGDVVKFQFLGYRTFDYHFWDDKRKEVVNQFEVDAHEYGYVPKCFKAYTDFEDPEYFDNVLHTCGNVWLDPEVFKITKDNIVDINDYKRNEGCDYDDYKCVKVVKTEYKGQKVNVVYIQRVTGNFIYSYPSIDSDKRERTGEEIPQEEFTQDDVLKWFNNMEYVMVPWYIESCNEEHYELLEHIFGNGYENLSDHIYVCDVRM